MKHPPLARISSSLSHNYCREYLGKRCKVKTTDNVVFQKFSLISAINNKKCMKVKIYDKGAVNAERFCEFLIEVLENQTGKLVILDNGKIHKTEETKEIIEASGNKVLYTIPYHPRLNVIEQWFSQLKHYMKNDKPMGLNALKLSVKNSIKNIKKEHYKNYFIYGYNMGSYITNLKKKSTKQRKLKNYKN